MQAEFAAISREYPDAVERVFEDVDNYVHMLLV